MERIRRLEEQARRARPGKPQNHTRAVSAYFDMVSYCYNAGGGGLGSDIVPDVPELDSPDFWELFDRLDLKCTREEMQAWIDFRSIEEHILPRQDDGVRQLDEYLKNR